MCSRVATAVVLASLLAAGCGGTDGNGQVLLRLMVADEALRPDTALLTWVDGDHVLFADRKVPREGALPAEGPTLATVAIDVAGNGERKALVRGLRGGVVVSHAAQRIAVQASGRVEATLTLSAALVDSDADGWPDTIDDDCERPACAPAAQPPDAAPPGDVDAPPPPSDAAPPADTAPQDAAPDTVAPDSAAPDTAPPDSTPPDAAPPPRLDLWTGLVGYWRFDEAASSAVATDSSGNGNDGNLESIPANMARVPGRHGTALDLRAGGWVKVPSSSSINGITSQVTIAAWVYRDVSSTAHQCLLSRHVGTASDEHYNLTFGNGHPKIILNKGQPSFVSLDGANRTPLGKWVHLAATYDGSEVRIYEDGVLLDSEEQGVRFATDTTPVYIGANWNYGAPNEGVGGRLDEVLLYKRALTAAQIKALADGAQPAP